MKINLNIKDNVVVGYRQYPIDENKPWIELDRIPEDLLSGEYKFINNKLVKNGSATEVVETMAIEKAVIFNAVESVANKSKAMEAFDRYRLDVLYKVRIETLKQHERLVAWYKENINKNNTESIAVPNEIKEYMEV